MARRGAARVEKAGLSTATRRSSRLTHSQTSGGALQEMVDEALQVKDLAQDQMDALTSSIAVKDGRPQSDEDDQGQSGVRDNGKSRLVEQEAEERAFRIMDLPAEIRLEIFRACLTRPHRILLSKRDPFLPTSRDAESDKGYTPTAIPQLPHQPSSRSRPGDTLNVNILRASKQIYKEARGILYSENTFKIDLDTAVGSLAALHQRSRRHIKHIELDIPTYTDILEGFSEVVRLSLRYCAGLKKLVIHMPFALPGGEAGMVTGNSQVFANGFDILRWLPQECDVVIAGTRNSEIVAVVEKHLRLAKAQDRNAYAHHQYVLGHNRQQRPVWERKSTMAL